LQEEGVIQSGTDCCLGHGCLPESVIMENIYCVPDCKIWKGEKNHCLFNGSHALTSCSMQSSIDPLNMPDPIRICSGLAWKHLPEMGWMIVAHRLASRLDTFGKNLTQSARTELDLGWFHTV